MKELKKKHLNDGLKTCEMIKMTCTLPCFTGYLHQ